MPRRLISMTFLWTDEAVMLEDFQLKVSRTMLEWAREFYKTYDIELAVKPEPDVGRVALAHKFALVKSGGIVPEVDRDLDKEFAKEFQQRREKIQAEIDKITRERDQVRVVFEALPSGHPDFDRLYEKLMKSYDQVDKLRADLDKIDIEEKRKKALQDYDTWLRLQMTDKWVFSQIGGHDSINIVFARFKRDDSQQKGVTLGITKTLVGFNPVMFAPGGIPRWLWPYVYILIDVRKDMQPRTLAHELVHAFGEIHPPDPVKIFKSLEKLLNYRHPRSMLDIAIDRYLGLPTYESLFEEVEGGYFDGPDNDIMNYTLGHLKNPSDFILHERDRERIFDSKQPFIVDIP